MTTGSLREILGAWAVCGLVVAGAGAVVTLSCRSGDHGCAAASGVYLPGDAVRVPEMAAADDFENDSDRRAYGESPRRPGELSFGKVTASSPAAAPEKIVRCTAPRTS